MTLLADIVGQDQAIARIAKAIESDRVPHAYLFTGPIGSGKYTAGLALAMALNCETAPGKGCSACLPCDKILNGNHPDVVTLLTKGKAQIIPIESIRTQVLPVMGMLPHEGRARVFLVQEANTMRDEAANALLKTLEEPPARTHFVLCTSAPDNLLPTIRSRCQRVSFAALPADQRARLAGDDEQAQALAGHRDALCAALKSGDQAAIGQASEAAARELKSVLPLLSAIAEHFAARAREAASAGELTDARALSMAAGLAVDAESAMTLHNANGQLSLEALFGELRVTPHFPA